MDLKHVYVNISLETVRKISDGMIARGQLNDGMSAIYPRNHSDFAVWRDLDSRVWYTTALPNRSPRVHRASLDVGNDGMRVPRVPTLSVPGDVRWREVTL